MIYFILYIYSILLCGTIYVGPVSIRVVATCLMSVYLLFSGRKNKELKYIDKSYIWIYLLFSVVMGLSLLANGEFGEYDYVKKFLAYNFVSIIAFFAIEKFVNSHQQLRTLIISLLLLIFVDDIITILQYMKNPISWAIGYVFGDIDKFAGRVENHDSLLGMSATPGLFGDVVKNAYLITVFTPLCFCLPNRQTKFITNIFSVAVYVASFIAIFMTQQRAAFFITLLGALAYFLVIFKKHTGLIIFATLIVSVLYLLIWNGPSQSYDLGRLTDVSDSSRSRLMNYAFDFIMSHPLFGGPVSFLKKAGLPAHNIILDSYINAGFFGFVIMTMMFLKASIKSTSNIFHSYHRKKNQLLPLFTSYALLSCMIYGLSHNTSFLNGEVSAFILLAIMLKVDELTRSQFKSSRINRKKLECETGRIVECTYDKI